MDDIFLRELKSRITLSSYLSTYLQVVQKGNRKMACCPFHKEKSPSFYIDDDRGSYHCFGCGAHGDAISFMREHLSLSFVDAVKELCVHTGTALPEFKPPTKEALARSDIMVETLIFMQSQLEGSSNAKAYLSQRGMKKDIIDQFQIAFGGKEKNGLYKFLKGKNFTDDDIIKSGVCIKSSYGFDFFDRFNNRIIFPIHSASGKVIAFSGRIFNQEENTAKYVNSPETEYFKKGNILYNFHNARKTKERSVVVCEGFMDVIAFYKDGIHSAVAQMGTAFTKEHLQLLSARFEEIIFCLDSDSAGVASQKRIIETLFTTMTGDKTFSFIVPHGTKDPDEYLEKYGVNSLKELFQQRITLHQHTWNLFSKGVDIQNPAQVLKLEKELSGILEKNPDIKKHYQSFFKNQIYQSKFKKNQNIVITEEKTPTTPIHEINAIAFAYTHQRFLQNNDIEYEIYFQSEENKKLYEEALAGEDISEKIDISKCEIPNTSDENALYSYYMLLYYSSLLYKIDEEIKANTENFQCMMFLAKERQRIMNEIAKISDI
ncbi:MAG: DNA primase [Proteobacteria bacterium]|jgi:DNA primase|nr:DNA primase [Pseudomonadota bacterium]